MEQALRFTYDVESGDLTQAGEASSQMKSALKRLGLAPETIRRASVCMYEGEINMVIHAEGGTATVEVYLDKIVITLADRGPGIPDIERAMEPGWSTAGEAARGLGFGAGMGLPNMKKYSDEMDIQTTVGVGTTITLTVQIA